MSDVIFEMVGCILGEFVSFESLKLRKFNQSQYLELTRSVLSLEDFTIFGRLFVT